MSPLLLPFPPDASPLGPPAARVRDDDVPVAPAAGEPPRVLPGSVVTVLGRRGEYRVEDVYPSGVVNVLGDDGYRYVPAAAVRGVA